MNKTLTLEQEQALSSLNRVWAMVEMMGRTFAEDNEPGSREKFLTAWYMLEDTIAGSRSALEESFS